MREKNIFAVAVLATLLPLPIFFKYLDGTSPNAYVHNVTDRLVQTPHIAPIVDVVIPLWNASVDGVCFPFFKAVELLLVFTELSEQFILYMIEFFPNILISMFLTPTKFLIRVLDDISSYISDWLYWLVSRENKIETREIVFTGFHTTSRKQLQCPINKDKTDRNIQSDVLVIKHVVKKCAGFTPQSCSRQSISYAYQLYQAAVLSSEFILNVLKLVVSYIYHAVCISLTMLSGALYLLQFILVETSLKKSVYISDGLAFLAASFFSLVSSFLNIIMSLMEKLEFGLKSLLPGVLQLVATNRFYIFYPMMYIGLILYSIVKLISIIFSVIARLIFLCLQFVVSVIGNVLWLVMSFILLFLVIVLLSVVLAVIIVSLMFVVGICEYIIIRFLLKSQPRILSKLLCALHRFRRDNNRRSRRKFKENTSSTIRSSEDTCVVCYNDKVLIKTKPCNHRACCYDCIRQIRLNDNRCPLCRSPIGTHSVIAPGARPNVPPVIANGHFRLNTLLYDDLH